MQEEKNTTTPEEKTGKKRRRRRKTSAAVKTAVQKNSEPAVKSPSENAAQVSVETSTPEKLAAEQPTAEAAVTVEAAQIAEEAVQPETAEPAQTSAEEAAAQSAQAELSAEEKAETAEVPAEEPTGTESAESSAPEETTPTEMPEPLSDTKEEETGGEKAAEASTAEENPGREENAEKQVPEPAAETSAPVTGAEEIKEETTEESSEAEEKAVMNGEETGTSPEGPSSAPAASAEQEEKAKSEAEEKPDAGEDSAETENPETAEENENLPDEDEQRLSDLTRTVQLSVEQIMARVNEEESEEMPPEESTPGAESEEVPATLQDQLRNGLSGMAKWFLLVVFFVLVIAVCGVAWLYRSATPDMLPQITVQFAGQKLEPTAYKWKVPVIGNLIKRTYADTISSEPVKLSETVDQTSPDFVISPSDYRTELTVTDAEEEVLFEGDVDTFSSFQFTANGDYTVKLVLHADASSVPGDTSVTGSETWYFSFTLGVHPDIRLSGTSVSQGSVAAVRVGDTLDGTQPSLQTELKNTGFFKAASGWVCYLPIPWNEPAGTQTLVVTAGGYTETLELQIKATSWEYKDYSQESQRVSPYIGQNDIPAELQKLLQQSEQTIAWSNSGFVQPFLNTLDVKLAFGSTEYVGRSYSQRSTNNGTGGRTVTNLVLNTTSGELLIAPASGKVLLAKDLGGNFGYTLVIDHGAGVKSIFYNLQKINVKVGSEVKQGQTLASCGRTTVAEMRIGTVPVDPLQIWRGQCDALKYY